MHVWSWAKENNSGYSEGHTLAQPASNTHRIIEGTEHTPHGGMEADHSLAAESGWIRMHVWGWAKDNNSG